MIFARSDSEMISKLAKSIAHFFVVQNITEESKEVIYAYGMELLISDVLNTIIVLLIALFSHTLPAVVVFIAVFMGLRQFVGGFHANSHLSCMFTLVMVMMVFSYGICNVSGHITPIFSISFIMIALPIILCIAPVPHPNKPMSEEKSVKLRKRSCILAVTLSVVTIALLVFQYQKLSLYVKEKIKPYFIFNNAQLEEIIKTNPQTLEELKSIKGFGDAKCLKYGKDILMILGDY